METFNRYIIVANSVCKSHKIWKILDLDNLELLSEVYDYEPFDECLVLNKKENGATVIEYTTEEQNDEDFEKYESDESLDEDEISMLEQEKLSRCWCDAWQWSENRGDYIRVADCCCGAE